MNKILKLILENFIPNTLDLPFILATLLEFFYFYFPCKSLYMKESQY